MSHREKEHMGRSTGEERDLVGRDLRGGDVIAESAAHNDVQRPPEEGENLRADRSAAADRSADERSGDERSGDDRSGDDRSPDTGRR